ncbi:MAG: excisionase family DNA-binding protein [Gemmatimonadales bacterium]|jgi:excisionase family DNA binding protein
MDSLLTTGEVARLFGVTPDAVLKWVKKGRLPATRTAGGHYRISRDACAALGRTTAPCDESRAGDEGRPEREPLAPRCWEYFGQPGDPPEVCRNCLVYQARVQHCYMLADLGEDAGHRCAFCRTDCIDCPFYRASYGLATTVLVVTRDEALTRKLRKRVAPNKVSLHFARTGYDSSTLIGTLRPAVVVLDSELPEVSEGSLAESISRDDRIPGVQVIVAQRHGDEEAVGKLAMPAIAAPFTAERIERIAESATGAGRGTRGDAA